MNTNTNNPFHRDSLVEDNMVGYSLDVVENILQYTDNNSSPKCIICGNIPRYRLIPRKPQYNTAEIQDKGFVCGHCCTVGAIDNNMYGLREMSK